MLTTAYEIAAIIAAICGILGIPTACVWVLKRLRAANQADTKASIDAALKPLTDQVAGIDQRTTRMEAQFSNNGGGTLRDRVDTAVRNSAVTNQRLDDHLRQADDDRHRLAAVERVLIQRKA